MLSATLVLPPFECLAKFTDHQPNELVGNFGPHCLIIVLSINPPVLEIRKKSLAKHFRHNFTSSLLVFHQKFLFEGFVEFFVFCNSHVHIFMESIVQ